MPQMQPATLYFPSLSFSAFLQSLLSNLIPSRQTSFVLACACFVLLCLPFGFDLPRVCSRSRVEAEAEAFEGQNLVPITTASLQPLPRSSLLLHISCLCPECPAVVFSYRVISWTAMFNVCECRLLVLSSRRQWWGKAVVTSPKITCGLHAAAILLFLYSIKVRQAGNPGHLLNSKSLAYGWCLKCLIAANIFDASKAR